MKLHCFSESGNAYKAALSLQLAGLNWDPVFVDFFKGETRNPEFRALNPMGEVPVLVDCDLVLTQSGVIQSYVTEKTGKLGGTTPAEAREVLRWTIFDNQKICGMAGPLRFVMNFLPAEKRSADVIAFLTGRLTAALQILETTLATRDWLVGGALSNADIACCGYLYYPEPFSFERVAYPHIDAWLDRIAATPGWKHPYDLMPAPTVGQDNRSTS
jgi:glutathione S-transferase